MAPDELADAYLDVSVDLVDPANAEHPQSVSLLSECGGQVIVDFLCVFFLD